MIDKITNIFLTPKLSSIFQKHHWYILSNPKKNFHFNYQGEIADYYLIVSYSYNYIQFDYTLDLEVPEGKIYLLLKLINFVNQKTRVGFFIYDLKANKVKFKMNIKYFINLKYRFVEDVIEEKLTTVNYLFNNFSLATHNLMYTEKIDQSHIELMFLEVEGSA